MSAPPDNTVFDVLVIGGGVAGLAARCRLESAGLSVLLIEKSRGLGGRASTRRGPGWMADLGAQFTSVSDPRWQAILKPHLGELREVRIRNDTETTRFAHRSGMSSLGKLLRSASPRGGPIALEKRVTSLSFGSSSWKAHCESGELFRAKCLLLAIPLPQARTLLEDSGVPLANIRRSALSRIEYSSCIALCSILENPLPDSIAPILRAPSPALSGIYDQKRKGLETEQATLVIHGSAELSSRIWDSDERSIRDRLLAEASAALEARGARPAWKEILLVHRWRFSEPGLDFQAEAVAALSAEDRERAHPPLFFAGDGLTHASVEAAFQSGLSAGFRITSSFGTGAG